MSEKRRALGRGLGALIPSGTATAERPVDVFFKDREPPAGAEAPAGSGAVAEGRGAAPAATGTPAAEPDTSGLQPVPGAGFAEVPLDAIRPNPKQPRTVFDEDELAELVHSIREIGVLQPVVVAVPAVVIDVAETEIEGVGVGEEVLAGDAGRLPELEAEAERLVRGEALHAPATGRARPRLDGRHARDGK